MNDTLAKPPRWLYRFDSYARAFGLLRAAVELMQERPLTDLEKEGVVQRFEYTWELAWKLLKDFLESEGVVFERITPLSVLRAALAARLIQGEDAWRRALDARNEMSHVYRFELFERVVGEIQAEYLTLFDDLHLRMLEFSMQARGIDVAPARGEP